MNHGLLQPLIKQLENSGSITDLAMARVLECANHSSDQLQEIATRLEKVEEQVRRTNGRVTHLEDVAADIKLKSVPPESHEKAVKDIDKISSRIDHFTGSLTVVMTILGTSIVVFGSFLWERFVFLSTLDAEKIREISATIFKLH